MPQEGLSVSESESSSSCMFFSWHGAQDTAGVHRAYTTLYSPAGTEAKLSSFFHEVDLYGRWWGHLVWRMSVQTWKAMCRIKGNCGRCFSYVLKSFCNSAKTCTGAQNLLATVSFSKWKQMFIPASPAAVFAGIVLCYSLIIGLKKSRERV